MPLSRFRLLLAVLGLIATAAPLAHSAEPGAHPVPPIQQTETPAQRDERMAWWRAARFGMFIHWGLYAEPAGIWDGKPVAGIGEWIMNRAHIPVGQYKELAKTFNPVRFNADAWVAMARDAGVKYIVITAKHHDGFAMFRSQANRFNIYDATPFRRDPLKELAAACAKYGVRLGFYYSQDQDWTAPGAAAIHGHWDPQAQDGSFAQYLEEKALPQLDELLTHYAPFPAVVWFDTPTKDMTPELAAKIVTLLNKHPGLIWNNRLGGGYKGDTETPEQHIPGMGYPGEDWETCMTMNDTWGYKRDDHHFKSPETLVRNLIDIASKGGNYLLNVGPDAMGVIPQPEVDRMLAVGRWLKVNGAAIYGTSATPFGAEAGSDDPSKKDKKGNPIFHATWVWRCTQSPGHLYVHLFEWPQDGIFRLPATAKKIKRARLLASPGKKLKFEQSGDGTVVLHLPASAPDPIATVAALDY
jgi:alpha-L-fucosidase